MTRLVLICGLPASGKSTLAHELAASMPAVLLSKDEWVTALGQDLWDDAFRDRLEAQLWALTQELLVHGLSVILEWGHWARSERDSKRVRARELGVEVELHYLDGPLDELIARVERRNASAAWLARPITRDEMQQWAAVFAPPDDDELALFDAPRRT